MMHWLAERASFWRSVATLLCALALAPTTAEAQIEVPFPAHRRADGYTYYKQYHLKSPERGYSGFYGIGPRQSYCDYRRTPNRVCDSRGCRVKGWTLEQYCY